MLLNTASVSLRPPHSRLDGGLRVLPPLLHLVQRDEGGRADVVLLQELDALLRRVHRVHHDVVERAAGGGDGHVVLLVDGAQVTLRRDTAGYGSVMVQGAVLW